MNKLLLVVVLGLVTFEASARIKNTEEARQNTEYPSITVNSKHSYQATYRTLKDALLKCYGPHYVFGEIYTDIEQAELYIAVPATNFNIFIIFDLISKQDKSTDVVINARQLVIKSRFLLIVSITIEFR